MTDDTMNLFRDLVGIRTVAPGVDCMCPTPLLCAAGGGVCPGAYEAAHQAIIEDRDHWLDLGKPMQPIELQEHADPRGLPVYRVPARTSALWVALAP